MNLTQIVSDWYSDTVLNDGIQNFSYMYQIGNFSIFSQSYLQHIRNKLLWLLDDNHIRSQCAVGSVINTTR